MISPKRGVALYNESRAAIVSNGYTVGPREWRAPPMVCREVYDEVKD